VDEAGGGEVVKVGVEVDESTEVEQDQGADLLWEASRCQRWIGARRTGKRKVGERSRGKFESQPWRVPARCPPLPRATRCDSGASYCPNLGNTSAPATPTRLTTSPCNFSLIPSSSVQLATGMMVFTTSSVLSSPLRRWAAQRASTSGETRRKVVAEEEPRARDTMEA
jgi:hypothetical protein